MHSLLYFSLNIDFIFIYLSKTKRYLKMGHIYLQSSFFLLYMHCILPSATSFFF